MTPDYQAVIESAWRLGGKEAAEETFLRLLQEKALLWCSYRIPANSVGCPREARILFWHAQARSSLWSVPSVLDDGKDYSRPPMLLCFNCDLILGKREGRERDGFSSVMWESFKK